MKKDLEEAGFANWWLLIILAVVVLAAAGYFGWWFWNKEKTETPTSTASTSTISTTDWKTYENKDFGFSFKSPSSLTFKETIDVKEPQNIKLDIINQNVLIIVYKSNLSLADIKKISEKQGNVIIDGTQSSFEIKDAQAVKYGLGGITEGEEIDITNSRLAVLATVYSNPGNTMSVEIFETILSTFQFTDSQVPTAENLFDRNTVKTGDKIVGMEVVDVKRIEASGEAYQIRFKGKTTLSGSFIKSGQDSMIAGEICLDNLNPESELLIPKEKNDTRTIWFCFSNTDYANGKLGTKTSGNAEVVIDDYFIDLREAGVFNTATLIFLENK